jgi:hypothetical protein
MIYLDPDTEWQRHGQLLHKLPDATYETSLLKAQKEIQECLDAPKHKRLLEYADAIICIKQAAECDGFSHEDLTIAESYKMRVNLVRNWSKQDDGTYQHIEEKKGG